MDKHGVVRSWSELDKYADDIAEASAALEAAQKKGKEIAMRDRVPRTKTRKKRKSIRAIKPLAVVRQYKKATYDTRVYKGIRKLRVILRDVQAGATLNKRTVERTLDNLRRLYITKPFSPKTIDHINDIKRDIEAASKPTTLKPGKRNSTVRRLHEPSRGTYCPRCDMKYLKVFHDEYGTRTEHCTFCGYKNEIRFFRQ